jgi:hypothetical protein
LLAAHRDVLVIPVLIGVEKNAEAHTAYRHTFGKLLEVESVKELRHRLKSWINSTLQAR